MDCYARHYSTPDAFDDIMMFSDGTALTGLCFIGSKGALRQPQDCIKKDLSVFDDTFQWLDIYFSGRQPDFTPAYRINGLTPFRLEVQRLMLEIPFGVVTTYGHLAETIAAKRGTAKMSAQAVGGAVGWNPLCIIIPCHRVVGSDGALTGYGGGLNNKIALLQHEGGLGALSFK